jgi:formate dehydrogenase subunit delta
MKADKLVYMANQIAAFFRAQPAAEAQTAVAEHVRSFWSPAMRRDIYAHLRDGGEGLDPVARAGLETLMEREAPAGRTSGASG